MYIVVTSVQSPQGNAYYSSIAGKFLNPTPHTGVVEGGSVEDGYLHAVCEALRRLVGLFGVGGPVDVVVPDQELAKKFQNASSSLLTKLTTFDNKDLWKEVADFHSKFKLNFVTDPESGELIARYWEWQQLKK